MIVYDKHQSTKQEHIMSTDKVVSIEVGWVEDHCILCLRLTLGQIIEKWTRQEDDSVVAGGALPCRRSNCPPSWHPIYIHFHDFVYLSSNNSLFITISSSYYSFLSSPILWLCKLCRDQMQIKTSTSIEIVFVDASQFFY